LGALEVKALFGFGDGGDGLGDRGWGHGSVWCMV
jgi:hypothetical protein